MHWIKAFKISTYNLLGIIVLLLTMPGCTNKQIKSTNKDKYSHYIGYLNPKTTDFKNCSEDKIYGYFASASTYTNIFNGNKSIFVRKIKDNYNSTGINDTGFLNFRFLINCYNQAGNFEINQLNSEYEACEINQEITKQLLPQIKSSNAWQTPPTEEPIDFYMYLVFKLENGKIVEILP